MIDAGKELIFSESVKAGKRIYYFDVKQSRNGDKYVAITESKKIASGPQDNPTFTFEKHKLFLYKEDYDKFLEALNKVIDIASDKKEPIKDEPAISESQQSNPFAADSLDFTF